MSLADLAPEPRLHLRLASGCALGPSADGAAMTIQVLGGQPQRLGPWEPAFGDAAGLLAAGAPLAGLRDAVIAGGGAVQAAAFVLAVQRLAAWGAVEFPLVDGGEELAVVRPQWHGFTPSLAADEPEAGAALDRFALIRRDGGAWLLESPLAGARFAFRDLAALEAPLVRRALAAAGLLEGAQPEARRETLAQWEFHDLAFHVHSRVGWHRDPLGGLFPYIDEIEPPPAARPRWPGERVALARASNSSGGEPFSSVLERRRSERFYDGTITAAELGALLDRAARIRSFEEVTVANFMGRSGQFGISHRPYPNGGASYELEIYPVVDRCEGLEAGLYHYDAAEHELVRISGRTAEVDRMLADAHVATAYQAEPQIVLAIAARFTRVMWKYKSIAYAVILRNAGALYQTLYLAATELGLSPCGVGSGDSALFAGATGLDPVLEGTVGEFLLGGAPRRP